MKKITLCLMLILALIIVPGAIFAAEPEAEINETPYDTLVDAIAAVTDGTKTTITLLRDVTDGRGFAIPEGRNITIDFDTHTYNVSQYPAGSGNTKTNGCQLLKNSNIVFKNGTFTANCVAQGTEYKSVKVLIQNYSNLTLENMVIDATKGPDMLYGVSINNGDVEISGNTSIESTESVPAIAMCWWPSAYPNGAQVTVDTTGTIKGNIEYSAYDYNGFDEITTNLTIENVKHNGEIIFSSEEIKELAKEEIKIEGGKFSSDVSDYVELPEGMAMGTDEEGNFVIAERTIKVEGLENVVDAKEAEKILLESFEKWATENPTAAEPYEKTNVIISLNCFQVPDEDVDEINKEIIDNFKEELNKKDPNANLARIFLDASISVENDGMCRNLDVLVKPITLKINTPKEDDLEEGYERKYYVIKAGLDKNTSDLVCEDISVAKLSADKKTIEITMSDPSSAYAIAYSDVEKPVVTPPTDEDNTGDGTVTPPAGDNNTGDEDNNNNQTVIPGENGNEQKPEDKPVVNDSKDKNDEDVPKTGDNVVIYAVFAVMAMAGMAITIKMRKK